MRFLLVDESLLNNMMQAFCQMLIHSLWQGLLFTVVTGIMLFLTKKSSAAVRYTIISFLLFLFITVCTFTFIQQWNAGQSAVSGSLPRNNSFLATLLQAWGLPDVPAIVVHFISAQAPAIVMTWFIIFSFKCIKMTGALRYNEHIRSHGTHSPSRYWLNKIRLLSEQLQLKKKVLLLESEIARIPVVLGHLKPVILIPLGLLSNLPAGQVEAVLLHELAHIRRSDYFVNLLQNLVETVFFFNPGLLWISSLLREERENCCDDIALSQTKNKKQFIQALVSFKEYAVYTPAYAPAFPGKKNQLLQRVTRIIYNKNKTLNSSEKIFFIGSLIVLSILLVTAGNNPAGQAAAFSEIVSKEKEPAGKTTLSSQVFQAVDKNTPVEGEIKKKNVSTVIAYYHKSVTTDNSEEPVEERQQAVKDEVMMMNDLRQAEADRRQADQDMLQAMNDQQQSEMDRVQNLKDKEQFEADKEMALRDRESRVE